MTLSTPHDRTGNKSGGTWSVINGFHDFVHFLVCFNIAFFIIFSLATFHVGFVYLTFIFCAGSGKRKRKRERESENQIGRIRK